MIDLRRSILVFVPSPPSVRLNCFAVVSRGGCCLASTRFLIPSPFLFAQNGSPLSVAGARPQRVQHKPNMYKLVATTISHCSSFLVRTHSISSQSSPAAAAGVPSSALRRRSESCLSMLQLLGTRMMHHAVVFSTDICALLFASSSDE